MKTHSTRLALIPRLEELRLDLLTSALLTTILLTTVLLSGCADRATLPAAPRVVRRPPDPVDYARLFGGVQRTVLPNGLVVLSKEVHRAPIVAVRVLYRVGFRDERVGFRQISRLTKRLVYPRFGTLGPYDVDRLA